MSLIGVDYLKPDWPAPTRVKSLVSTRRGGISLGAYQKNNLALHVRDNPLHVHENRQTLAAMSGQSHWSWLEQVHGTDIVGADASVVLTADGSYTGQTGIVCCVLSADCLPILLCDSQANKVVAVHAGWRGLAAGILDGAVSLFEGETSNVMVYLGPAISQRYYEVGPEVKGAFMHLADHQNCRFPARCFIPSSRSDHYYADLYSLARWHLGLLGIKHIYGGRLCTYSDQDLFFSHRRDGLCGRTVTAIWLEN